MRMQELRKFVDKHVSIHLRDGDIEKGELFDWDTEQLTVSIFDEDTGVPFCFKAKDIESVEVIEDTD